MGSSNIKNIITAFSPFFDFLAISSGDGRIKVWDVLKGQIQNEFADFTSAETSIYTKPERGHLSIDYTCMKWLSINKKKKRKRASSLLVLGTGSGDLFAIDVSAGQLKWKVSDCHPGGVTAISYSGDGLSCLYTGGEDGMLCEIDILTGSVLRKLKASTKAISSVSVSPDGKRISTAAAQLKIFNCSDHKKIHKFSGHPASVRCMIFTEDGRYILSSAIGERYVAVWMIDGKKKKSASCVLGMEHPAVFLDSRCTEGEGVNEAGLSVLAISEVGTCYYWSGRNLDELRNTKPTKVSSCFEENYRGSLPSIFAAKLLSVRKSGSGQLLLAHGLIVKPIFQKALIEYGTDVVLKCSRDGVLLSTSQSLSKSKKGIDAPNKVTTVDRANAEDALRPIPRVFDSHDQNLIADPNERITELIDSQIQDDILKLGSTSNSMENRLRSSSILSCEDDISCQSVLMSTIFNHTNLESIIPEKRYAFLVNGSTLRAAVLSMAPNDASKLLGTLVEMWKSRPSCGKYVLPWIYNLMLYHSQLVMSHQEGTQILDSLLKIAKSRTAAIQPLLQLSGRLQLVTAQVSRSKTQNHDQDVNSNEEEDVDEDEDEEVEDVIYGQEVYESEISSDEEN